MNDNEIKFFIIGFVFGLVLMLTLGKILVTIEQEETAVEYGIGGFDPKTGKFSYYEEKKCVQLENE